jgi:hypothetical protein
MDEQDIKKILEASAKSNQETNKKIIKDLTEELKKGNLNPAQIRNINTELKKHALMLKMSEKDLEDFNNAVDKGTKKQLDLLEASEKLEKGFYQSYRAAGLSSAAATEAAEKHKKATEFVKAFGSAAHKGSGKIDEYTSVFKGRLGGFGDVVVGIGSSLQSNVDIYRTLSNVGAAFGQDLVKLRETAAAAGLPIEDFTKLIKDNSQSLSALYGSTTLGATNFSRLSKEFRTANIEYLAPLGLTVDDLNEALLTTLNISRLTGSIDIRDTKTQQAAARELVVEMDKLSKLTGQSRQALTKELQAQMTQTNFMSFMSKQTKETQLRLQSFAAGVTSFAPELKTGLLDLIASQGVPTTKAAEELVMTMRGSGAIVKQLTSGQIDTATALRMMQDEAKSSKKTFGDLADYGVIPFVDKLLGGVNRFATAQMNLDSVSAEALKRQSSLTNSLTQFENASKTLSASFQSIETGFFAYLGGTLGKGIEGTNIGVQMLAATINSMSPATKALLYVGTKLSSYILDKATQIGVVYAGTFMALKQANMAGGANMFGGMGGAAKQAGKSFIKSPMAGYGVGGLVAGVGSNLAGPETEIGKGLGVLSGALTGAAVGSIFGPIGTAVGAVAGGLMSMAGQADYSGKVHPVSRASGTLGEIGLPFEPKTTNLKVHAGERVLSPQETSEYNKAAPDAGQTQYMMEYNQTAKQLLEATKDTNALLNKQVAIAMATEKNTKKTYQMVDKVGPSIV